MTRKMLIGMGALVAVIAAGAAWANSPHGRHFMSQQALSQRVAKMEDLVQATPQQREKIDASVKSIVGKLQAQRQAGQNMHQQLLTMLTGDQLSADDITNMAAQHAEKLQAMVKSIAPDVVAIHDALTPAQRQTLAQHAQQMRQKHQHGTKGGFGGPEE